MSAPLHTRGVAALSQALASGQTSSVEPVSYTHLPVGGGQHAGDLAFQVDLGPHPEAEGRELLVDQVHAHLVGQRVVVDVAALDDGAGHVHRAQAMVAVAAEGVVAELVGAAVVDLSLIPI